ncbi:hypothetical protein TKK_0012931 [Trichogramma kaykai]
MPKKTVEDGFVKGDSSNLPKVTAFMVFEFLTRDDRFNTPETRNVKLSLSSRESHGDSAVGYVRLQRMHSMCTVKADICPEHRVRQKDYTVILKVDERAEQVTELQCLDCAASTGGCKHAVAFLMWVHRRTEDISPTETTCYWKKASLSTVGTSLKYIVASELISQTEKISKDDLPDDSTFLKELLIEAQKRNLDSQLTRHNFEMKDREVYMLSMHYIFNQCVTEGLLSVSEVIQFSKQLLQDRHDLCKKAELENLLWFELRYGRITASKLYEASKCSTGDGSLLNQIIGASKKFDSKFMERGRNLESDVMKTVESEIGKKIEKSGFIIIPEYPMIGASPDGIGDDFVVEVKCPSKEALIKNYIKNNKVTEKYKSQIILQMLAAEKKKGLFVVADPEYEQTKSVTIIILELEEKFLTAVLKRAIQFWEKNLFPKLLE